MLITTDTYHKAARRLHHLSRSSLLGDAHITGAARRWRDEFQGAVQALKHAEAALFTYQQRAEDAEAQANESSPIVNAAQEYTSALADGCTAPVYLEKLLDDLKEACR